MNANSNATTAEGKPSKAVSRGGRIGAGLRAFRKVSLESRILLVAAASLLPLALLSSVTLITAAQNQKARLLEAHSQTALSLAAAVESHFDSAIASLDAVASSPRLAQRDFEGLQQVSHELLERRPSWLNVVISDADGRQVVNARRPLAEQVPSDVMADSVVEAVRSRRAVISDLEVNPELQQQSFSVHVPVEIDGDVRYVITAVISPASMSDLVQMHPVPSSGVVTIVDRNFRVVTRSRDGSQWLGQSASGALIERLQRGGSGWVGSRTLDGTSVYSAYHTSASSGWSAIMGVPRRVVDSPLLWSYLAFGASIIISVMLGLLAAVRVGRTIVQPVRELESSAASVGRGEAPQIPQTRLPEMRRVGEALVSAHFERERALEREREARHVAEGASKAKDEFLAMLGHELRNPLAAISMASNLLERNRDELKPLHADAAAVVSRQVRHLARMTDDLLDAGRIVLGKIVLTRSRIDLSQVVETAMGVLRSGGMLDRHTVTLQAQTVWVDGDATRMEQIAQNLLTNAVKYTPEGGAIQVEVRREGRQAVLSVSDNGLGLDPALLSRVFDLFVQGERSIDRSQGGLGIGLTLVRRLAELHGGSAHAHSDGAGRGATFTVHLPAAEQPASQSSQVLAREQVRALHIALIEDNDDVRIGLRHLLELDGHLVQEAADGKAGLELLLSGGQFDLALIDIGLPLVGGLEIAQTIRAQGRPGFVLIAMSGYGGEQERARGLDAGFNAYLVKPVEPDVLRRVLGDLDLGRA